MQQYFFLEIIIQSKRILLGIIPNSSIETGKKMKFILLKIRIIMK